jgi:hypothetical protein
MPFQEIPLSPDKDDKDSFEDWGTNDGDFDNANNLASHNATSHNDSPALPLPKDASCHLFCNSGVTSSGLILCCSVACKSLASVMTATPAFTTACARSKWANASQTAKKKGKSGSGGSGAEASSFGSGKLGSAHVRGKRYTRREVDTCTRDIHGRACPSRRPASGPDSVSSPTTRHPSISSIAADNWSIARTTQIAPWYDLAGSA